MPTTSESRAYTIIRRRGGPEETIVCNRLFVAEGFVHFVDRTNAQPPYDEKLLLLIPADLIAEVRPVNEAGKIAHVDELTVQPGQNYRIPDRNPKVAIIDHPFKEFVDADNAVVCGHITARTNLVPWICGMTKEQHRS